MPTPPPTPIPIQLVGGPSWLDITTQLVIPFVSLGIAAAAILYTAAADKRRAAERSVEKKAAEQGELQRARDAYAKQLIKYSRRNRDANYDSTLAYMDEWRDTVTAAPDVEASKLVIWWGQHFGDLSESYQNGPAGHPQRRTQAILNLESEYYARVEQWRRDGQVVTDPPMSRDTWPQRRDSDNPPVTPTNPSATSGPGEGTIPSTATSSPPY